MLLRLSHNGPGNGQKNAIKICVCVSKLKKNATVLRVEEIKICSKNVCAFSEWIKILLRWAKNGKRTPKMCVCMLGDR